MSLAANIENHADKDVSNTDILMFSGVAVVSLITALWHAKRILTTKKHFVFGNHNNYERLIE